MFDSKKIDAYFNADAPLLRKEQPHRNVRAERIRIIKLLFPAVAAVLVGLLMLFPYIKSAQKQIDFDVTLPKKGELEKLHIENTKFNITHADNQISSFTADNIDETEPQSKIVKLVNPKGKIPLKNGAFADIKSNSGYYNQEKNQITMLEDVFINYNNETNIETKNVFFDFNTSQGKGNSPLKAEGIYGKISASSFEFDNKKNIFILLGNSDIEVIRKPSNVYLSARRKITLFKNKNHIVMEGEASVKNENNIIFADKISANYIEKNKQPEITKMEAFGNVSIDSEKGKIYADKGIYNPQTNIIEMFDNVTIEQDDNKIFGDYAHTDLNTGISKIIAKDNNRRVSGTFTKIRQLSSGVTQHGKDK